MDLFNSNSPGNILPYDGEVFYYGKILNLQKTQYHFLTLLENIEWKNDEAILFGKRIITKRKVAWYGDKGFSYTYSNTTKQAIPWTKELLELKKITEETTASTYNSCLLNLYHNGDEGVSWHSDDESTLGKHSAIAAFSFGAARKFAFKHKQTKETVSLLLERGSLMVMKGSTQINWLHSLPKSKKITKPRISLTFRTIIK